MNVNNQATPLSWIAGNLTKRDAESREETGFSQSMAGALDGSSELAGGGGIAAAAGGGVADDLAGKAGRSRADELIMAAFTAKVYGWQEDVAGLFEQEDEDKKSANPTSSSEDGSSAAAKTDEASPAVASSVPGEDGKESGRADKSLLKLFESLEEQEMREKGWTPEVEDGQPEADYIQELYREEEAGQGAGAVRRNPYLAQLANNYTSTVQWLQERAMADGL